MDALNLHVKHGFRINLRGPFFLLSKKKIIPIEQLCRMGLDPREPTTGGPGSLKKVLILAARYAEGVPLWHDADAYYKGELATSRPRMKDAGKNEDVGDIDKEFLLQEAEARRAALTEEQLEMLEPQESDLSVVPRRATYKSIATS